MEVKIPSFLHTSRNPTSIFITTTNIYVRNNNQNRKLCVFSKNIENDACSPFLISLAGKEMLKQYKLSVSL